MDTLKNLCKFEVKKIQKNGNLCLPFKVSNIPNIYGDVKKRLYALLLNVIKKYTCNRNVFLMLCGYLPNDSNKDIPIDQFQINLIACHLSIIPQK